MVDIEDVKYAVKVTDEKGKTYNITEYIKDLGWEENKNEISTRITFTARPEKVQDAGKWLTGVVKPGCYVMIYAKMGRNASYKQMARGKVNKWEYQNQNSDKDLKITAYDILYDLQKSQDYFRISSGQSAATVIKKIASEWKVPMGTYKGPTVKLGAKNYKGKYLSDVLLNILSMASKKDGKKYILRDEKSKMCVIQRGSNKDEYVFDRTNTITVTKTVDMSDMVTRVMIIGKAKLKKKKGSKKKSKKGKTTAEKVVGKVDGQIKFGIRQKIYNSTTDESQADAEKSAKSVLKKEGKAERDAQVVAVDVPVVRKGDKVYLNLIQLKGDYYVTEIHHDADQQTMTMNVVKKS